MTRKKNDAPAQGLAFRSGAEDTIIGWRRSEHPAKRIAWLRLLFAVGSALVAGGLAIGIVGLGPAGAWTVALFAGVAWWGAARFLLMDVSWRRFWIVWLILGAAAPVYLGPGPGGRALGLGMAVLFLLMRRFRALQPLGSRRRAGAFLMGCCILIVLAIAGGPVVSEGAGRFARVGAALAWLALWSLRVFWAFSLVHLFLGMRLHFLRLRPKLAVSGLFVALLPLLMAVAFVLLAGYGVQGGGRAGTGRLILQEWARDLDARTLDPAAADSTFFRWERGSGRETEGATPAWLDGFIAALDAAAADTLASRHFPADTTAYFILGDRLWLLRLRGAGSARAEVAGMSLDRARLDRLAGLVRADVGLYSAGGMEFGADEGATDVDLDLHGRFGEAPPDTGKVSFWRRKLGFGGSLVPVIHLDGGRFRHTGVLLHLSISPAELSAEFLSGEANEFNRVVLAALAVVAGLFLAVVAAALFFGVRITNGITAAVGDLHKGAHQLAAGDFDTHIDIPNEDELGDLALAFNDMTAAIRRGRDEAVARERLEREMATARDIQQRLLPHETPVLAGFEVTGVSVPSLQVGGDYFDFLDQGDQRLGVAVGDVSGKGMPAALLMANLQASLQGQVIHPSTVAEVVGRVNDLLVRSTDPHMFATFFYGVLDRRTASFTCTNAGHNPPLLLRADGGVEHLESGGLLLGMLPEIGYRQQTAILDPGDVLLLYTDGITEAMGPAADIEDDDIDPEAMFGDERLLEVARANAHRPAVEQREAILRAVNDFTAGVPQSDDITLVILRRQP